MSDGNLNIKWKSQTNTSTCCMILFYKNSRKCRQMQLKENMKGFPQGGEKGKGKHCRGEEQPLANDGYAPCVGVRMVWWLINLSDCKI